MSYYEKNKEYINNYNKQRYNTIKNDIDFIKNRDAYFKIYYEQRKNDYDYKETRKKYNKKCRTKIFFNNFLVKKNPIINFNE